VLTPIPPLALKPL